MGAIIFEGDKVLLVERAGEPLKGWWSIPGGLLETGETLEDGLRREVLEETGLQVGVAYRFEIFERIMRDAAGRALEAMSAAYGHEPGHRPPVLGDLELLALRDVVEDPQQFRLRLRSSQTIGHMVIILVI